MFVAKSGNHSQKDLIKAGYILEMKYKTIINLLYLWLHTQNQTLKIWQLETSKFISFLNLWNLKFSFWWNSPNKKKAGMECYFLIICTKVVIKWQYILDEELYTNSVKLVWADIYAQVKSALKRTKKWLFFVLFNYSDWLKWWDL